MVATDGKVSTVAGTGLPGYTGDGGPAVNAQLTNPWDNSVDETGTGFVADTFNHVIRTFQV
jgi:hypothetical protein